MCIVKETTNYKKKMLNKHAIQFIQQKKKKNIPSCSVASYLFV